MPEVAVKVEIGGNLVGNWCETGQKETKLKTTQTPTALKRQI
jgi:hypothetical protein